MHKRGMWAAGLIGAMVVGVGAGRAARAADDPLLVVVETQPGLGVDAADVRRGIASELGQRVVSPSDPAAPRASQVLIVALDEHDIRISMRTGTSTRVSRAIPDVAERAARLRAVAWLAGNLARDQVGPLLPKLALATPEPARSGGTPTVLATTAAAAIEPPPAATTTPASAIDAAVSKANPKRSVDDARWMITGSGGATVTDTCLRVSSPAGLTCTARYTSFSFGSSYQIEVQHRNPDDGLILGGALEAGPDNHLVGVAGLIGTRRSWGRWYFEPMLGAGIEVERVGVSTQTVISSSTSGTGREITTTTQAQPVLYARAAGTIGIPINPTFDFVARFGVHLASSGLSDAFASTTVGLRLKLP